MRVVMAGAAVAMLAGCGAPPSRSAEAAVHGRYAGIGVYAPGELWSRMAVAGGEKASGGATTADDEHVIVVVDGQSGEVRECGDYSGVCVSLQPWTRVVAKEQTAPVTLTRRPAVVRREQTPSSERGRSGCDVCLAPDAAPGR